VIVVSNQRGIALGLYTAADVDAIHAAFQSLLVQHGATLTDFLLSAPGGQCNCRKPLPGLFEQAVEAFPAITAATSVMMGDSLVDMEFGRRLGITSILIEGGPNSPGPRRRSRERPPTSDSRRWLKRWMLCWMA